MHDDQSTGNGATSGRSEQEQAERETRQTGGDAPAAGSIDEREAVADDTDELFTDGDRERNERDGGDA